MFRIVRNECLRRTRALLSHDPAAPGPGGPGRRDDPDRHETPDGEHASGGTARSAEEDVLLRLEAERVATAIAALPADQRQVLVMRDVRGLPGRTVAHSLGLSTAAMKSRLHRARSAVREALREDPARTEGDDGDT